MLFITTWFFVSSENTRLFIFVLYTFLFQENLSVSYVIKWKTMLPLYSDQISLLKVLAVIHRCSL